MSLITPFRRSARTLPATLSVLATGAVALLLLAGCSQPASPAATARPTGDVLQHVHGLALGPDGSVLVASHQGLYRVERSGETASVAGPIGDIDADLMGFTYLDGVAYASGHPGPATPADLGSPNLGFVRSTDGGATWESVSLAGQTDFHSLAISEARPDRVYGLDAANGRVLRSDDAGTTWTPGASLVAAQLLTSSFDADVVYATTEAGVQVSRDGGLTFTVDPAAPVLMALAETTEGTLIGVTPDGSILRQAADGGTWQSGGVTDGFPQAMLVDAAGRLLVADDRGIVATDDGGENWTPVWSAE